MELPSTPPSPALTGRYPVSLLLAVLALGVYAVFISHYEYAAASGSDQSGYFNHARLIASGSVHAAARTLPGMSLARAPYFLYVPLGMRPAADNRDLVPTYPVGFPLLLAGASLAVGWGRAAGVVLVFHSLAGLVLTYLLGRTVGLRASWSVLCAAIIAASPLYLLFSMEAMSDMPAMVWCVAAVLAAWRARDRAGWAPLAGAAFSIAILIRPTDALALAPIVAAMGWQAGAGFANVRRWSLFVVGGLPGAVFFCLHSRAAYGSFLATGYGGPGADFGAEWIGVTLVQYARWLPILLTPVVCLALGLPWLGRQQRRAAAVLGAWIIAFLAFYSAYRCTHEYWWYLRFLLPAAPALVVAGVLGLRLAASRFLVRFPGKAVLALAFGGVLISGIYFSRRLTALEIPRGEMVYSQTDAWLRANLPPNALILSMQMSGALFHDTDFTLLRWDMINAANRTAVMAAIRASHRPLYAALFPFETDSALKDHVPGHWTRVGAVDYVTIWRRDTD
jgi:hypothetical protein